jgi:hypothetical protein
MTMQPANPARHSKYRNNRFLFSPLLRPRRDRILNARDACRTCKLSQPPLAVNLGKFKTEL